MPATPRCWSPEWPGWWRAPVSWGAALPLAVVFIAPAQSAVPWICGMSLVFLGGLGGYCSHGRWDRCSERWFNTGEVFLVDVQAFIHVVGTQCRNLIQPAIASAAKQVQPENNQRQTNIRGTNPTPLLQRPRSWPQTMPWPEQGRFYRRGCHQGDRACRRTLSRQQYTNLTAQSVLASSVAVIALVSISGVAANSAAGRLRWTVAIAFSIGALAVIRTL